MDKKQDEQIVKSLTVIAQEMKTLPAILEELKRIREALTRPGGAPGTPRGGILPAPRV